MEVILTPENEMSLRSYIHEIITDEIAKVRKDASMDKRVLKQIEIAKYFGVSTSTIRKWESQGLPFGQIGEQKFYDKEQCRVWVLEQ